VSDRSLTILIPAYNEEDRLPPVLEEYVHFFRKHYKAEFRIVVVVNGSRDRTMELVLEAAVKFPEIEGIEYKAPIGKGGALIEGLKLASERELIGFIDADGATGPESFLKLARRCGDHCDCVIGSRRVTGSVIHQSQPSNRLFASRVFHAIVQTLFHMDIADTQCGAKVMRREVVEEIHEGLLTADMAFDINLLYLIHRAGGKIVEYPIDWTDVVGTKVQYFRTSLVMFLSVVRLRLIYSPVYRMMEPIRPLEAWIYKLLRNPVSLPAKRLAKSDAD